MGIAEFSAVELLPAGSEASRLGVLLSPSVFPAFHIRAYPCYPWFNFPSQPCVNPPAHFRPRMGEGF